MASAANQNKCPQNQWVAILPAAIANTNGSKNRIITLRHPRFDIGCQFLLCQESHSLFEIMEFKEEPRSWFVNNTVQQNGALLISTPVDPIFMILPYLAKVKDKFIPMDQILMDDKFPSCSRLYDCVSANDLAKVCECKGSEDLFAYRLSTDKLIGWIQRKIERVADDLRHLGVYAGTGSQSETFTRSSKDSSTSKDDYIKYTFGLISDYLSKDICALVEKKMNITSQKIEMPPSKKLKQETKSQGPTDDYTKFNPPSTLAAQVQSSHDDKARKLTSSERKLKKVDKTNIKSISSYFFRDKKAS
ncbi:uncharacterized protein TRIADDRAFT_60250 [Trichoplax adhaerens]|uniref:Ribonuclease H2 subunit B n=1 Tax=Trichoplax adhaerens TaxID=10228 RepID=B3S7Q1_TRIAD|nr:hypothetical protein TRIADDRAFT_60250 [Trichoplax adhaerens]EDV21233.1 hypothetical protein TRIADDRAFT_60250 [Trichoplax adhaerens]|eukprot:XP_002116200.1 hypothetical protein TRIADDRAFT_60250 [Trichoplax adhaerens]